MDAATRKNSVKWGILGVFFGLGLAGLMGQTGAGTSPKTAQAPTMARDGSGTIAFTSQLADASQLLYLIDTQNQSFAVYRVDPRDSKGAVKLEAARQYRWDLKLAEFNNQAPEVATIESMVGAPRR
jgi:hypothetical protein